MGLQSDKLDRLRMTTVALAIISVVFLYFGKALFALRAGLALELRRAARRAYWVGLREAGEVEGGG